jgi:hypothetical protein
VSPGDTWKDEITVSNLLDMNQPGKYTISLSRLDPVTNTVVKSNRIAMTITPQNGMPETGARNCTILQGVRQNY